MYYLYPLNELKICFQSESHTNRTKSKQIRKFFVSPVNFTKVHVRGFVNEPTIYWSDTSLSYCELTLSKQGCGNSKILYLPKDKKIVYHDVLVHRKFCLP